MHNRRQFLQQLGGLMAMSALPLSAESIPPKMFFDISLAEWSLHKAIFSGQMSNLDFPAKAKNDFGIDIVEYVNVLFGTKTAKFQENGKSTTYLKDLLQRCNDSGVKNHLIMCDGEGYLGDLNEAKRIQAVENHYKWVEAAKFLGCKTIRVNAHGEGSADEVRNAAVDGLGRLSEFAGKVGINVIVENHGGYSSNGEWLASVMKQVGKPNCGTLPDFGNFCMKWKSNRADGCDESYDRYKGTAEMMPFAKGVSAKTHDFDANGNETETDYMKMLKIVKDASFRGIIGIEYEGSKLSEEEGIKATKKLLEKVGAMLGT
jgi:Xylose isomerase-like TIM barrel